jgi:hypothetical protein
VGLAADLSARGFEVTRIPREQLNGSNGLTAFTARRIWVRMTSTMPRR